jgi:hypothetical protein
MNYLFLRLSISDLPFDSHGTHLKKILFLAEPQRHLKVILLENKVVSVWMGTFLATESQKQFV